MNRLTADIRFRLDELPAVVGRSSCAAIRLHDRWVSRVHFEISEINGTLVIRDLESRHGTFVNGERVSEALLFPGDRLTVGLSQFDAHYDRVGHEYVLRR
jgi:pSer/pThr/pTyr-binding forkhead associated (FHA) protein